MMPAIDDRLLPEHQATLAQNTWLYSGALIGVRQPKQLHILTDSSAKFAFRIPDSSSTTDIAAASHWLEFSDLDTTVVRTPVVDDTFERYYWASPSINPHYNTVERIRHGDPPFRLGIPAPSTDPGITVVGGSSELVVTRSYVVTWVSAYGEEGPPSPRGTKSGKQDGVWSLTLPTPDSGDLGTNRNLTKLRIYRTIVSASGTASYFLVTEQLISVTTWDDSAADEDVSLNNELESTNWSAPPDDLKGIFSMPNGMVVGFRANELWFCEPFRPHAWPSLYTITTEFPIVGIGVAGQSAIACTSSYPVVASGVNPASISQITVRNAAPCIARGSILSNDSGVFYTSPNGLVGVDRSGGVTNVTQSICDKEHWNSLVPITSLRAAPFAPAYFGFGSIANDRLRGIVMDLATTQPQSIGITLTTSTTPVVNVLHDLWSGVTLTIKGGSVYYYDFADPAPAYDAYLWRSRIVQMLKKDTFGVVRVFFDVPDGTTPQNSTRKTDLNQTLQSDQYGLVRAYADGNLVMCRELRTSGELMKLPSGFKADYWQFEIEARVRVFSFQFAGSAKELAGV
jgi:hypothetical protein